MELQIDVELPEDPAPRWRMHLGEITAHFREVMSLLADNGITQDQAAAAVGLSPTTLTAYGRGFGTAAWRQVPAVTLDRLRDLAVDAYWRSAAAPYRAELAAEADWQIYMIPVWNAVGREGGVREHHPHLLRVREIADKLGGSVRAGWSVRLPTEKPPPPPNPEAYLRGLWRRCAFRSCQAFGEDVEGAAAFLCDIADCDRYTLWTYSTEYRPFRTQILNSQVIRLEKACKDLEGAE